MTEERSPAPPDPDPPGIEQRVSGRRPADTRGRDILVVEDNPTVGELVRATLEGEGYRVSLATDGASALAQMAAQAPRLVLQDLVLPDIDGFELARRLRALPGGAELPILAVSGVISSQDEATKLITAGFTDVLLKPVEPSRLIQAAQACLAAPRAYGDAVEDPGILALDDGDPAGGERRHRAIHRLESQSTLGLGMARRSSLLAAELSVLRAVSGALSKHTEIDLALEEALNACLDAGGMTIGALYEQGPDGLSARIFGSADALLRGAVAHFFGEPALLDRAITAGEALRLPSAAAGEHFGARIRSFGLESLTVAPVEAAGERLGAIMMASTLPEPDGADRLPFAQTVANQIGQALSLAKAFQDLAASERRANEQAALLRSVLESISDGVLAIDDQGHFFLSNHAAHDLIGTIPAHVPLHRLQEVLGVYHSDGTTPYRSEEMGLAQALRGEVFEGRVVFVRNPRVPEGRWLSVTAQPLKGGDTSVGRAVVVLRDLTQEREAAAALRQAWRDFRQVIETAPDVVLIRRGERLVYANPAFSKCLGCPSAEHVVGRDVVSLMTPEDAAALPRPDGSIQLEGDIHFRRPNGGKVLLEFSPERVIQFEGEPALLAIGRDVTERKRLQAQLFIADRMASVGTLAAGVAHEINNPLVAVIANLELALERFANDDPLAADGLTAIEAQLQQAFEASARVQRIVRDLKVFSRGDEEAVAPVDVHRVLSSAMSIAGNEIRHRAQLVEAFTAVPPVLGSELRLGQVFLNLLVNAAQAIPLGRADANEIRVQTLLDGQGRVVVAISDTGTGMPPDVLDKLFTPFFTTKPVGVGTGLGLSICHRLVTAMNGEITIDSAVGQGTTVRVTLPQARSAPAPSAAGGEPRQAPRRGRVLVVDDEMMIGTVIGQILGSEHTVESATAARQALERIAAGATYDVIFCDLMMPEMTGMDFFDALSRQDSALQERVVFLTGGAFSPAAHAFLNQVPNARVEKPFSVKHIRELVAARLQDA